MTPSLSQMELPMKHRLPLLALAASASLAFATAANATLAVSLSQDVGSYVVITNDLALDSGEFDSNFTVKSSTGTHHLTITASSTDFGSVNAVIVFTSTFSTNFQSGGWTGSIDTYID